MTQHNLTYPNRFARRFLLAAEEIMGLNGAQAWIKLAELPQYIEAYPPDNDARVFPLTHFAALNTGFFHIFGRKGGGGLAFRAGRVMFSAHAPDYLPMVSEPYFADLALTVKLKTALSAARAVIENFSDESISQVESYPEHFAYTLSVCPVCYGLTPETIPLRMGRPDPSPICHFIRGFLGEALSYASGGQIFTIEQTECKAQGGANCVFVIPKSPTEQS
jgi:hypothetical protein